MAKPLINVPKIIRKGEPFEVKILISHPMESGQRRDAKGEIIPRDIIHSFRCTLDGELVMEADLFPAIAANPYLAFFAIAETSGTLRFTWTDDHDTSESAEAAVTVTG